MEDPVEIRIHPPKPHSKKQAFIMQAFNHPAVKEIYVSCGTKFGKSIAASTCMSDAVMRKHGSKWRWIAPIYDQAAIGMDYFRKILPPKPHTEYSKSRMTIDLPYMESQLQFWHTKNPVSLEGPGISGNIHDEAAKQPYDAVVSARTTTTFTGGPSMYISTPYGKGWFYKGCMRAKDEMEWAIKNGKQPSKVFITARTCDNPFVDPKVIAEAKHDLPARLFEMYYNAAFLDDGSVFTGFKRAIRGPQIEVTGAHQYWIDDKAKDCEVVIGVDWAKHHDYTVFGAFDYSGIKPRMVGFQRFQGMQYIDAVKELYRFGKQFKKVGIIYHDKTGVGETLDELMGNLPFSFEGITFSNTSKSYMVNQFMMTLEKDDIILANWPEMISELDSYEISVTPLGLAKYEAAKGQHDDIVSMLILANSALIDYRGQGMNIQFLEDLPKQKLTIEDWYRDLIDDDDDASLSLALGN